jgi:dihydrofolate reductase
MERKVILYIAMSLDGYIATKDNSIDFLSLVEKAGEDYGYNDFVQLVDTVIVGRKTYDKVIEMGYEYPHADKTIFIVTRNAKPSKGNVQYYSDDLTQLVHELKKQPGKHIYCDGGSEIANELMKNELIDEYIISIIPTLLGDGIKLFKDGRPGLNLSLLTTKQFDTGLTQLHFKRAHKE